jgi:F-type H+-transporting ATPase subunit delta
MKSSKATIRYAKALFEIARERGVADQVEKDLAKLGELIGSSREVRSYLMNPRIANAAKKKALTAMLSDGDSLTVDFVQLLIDKRRVAELVEVGRWFSEMKRQASGVVQARIESVSPLDEHLLGDLKAKLEEITGKHVQLESELNEELIGGMRIHLGSKLIDGSLKRRFSALRDKLNSTRLD